MFALILSIILIVFFYWWFRGDLLLTGAYVAAACLAAFSVPVMHRLTGYTRKEEVEWLEAREYADHQEMIARLSTLKKQLKELGIEEGEHQAVTLIDMLDDYHKVVETRFIGKKHSPIAYLSTARRVQKHAVQNLTDVVAVGHSLQSIARHDNNARADKRMQNLNVDQSDRLEALLAENRQLFEALTDTAVEVANISSYSDYERLDTMARLVSLSEIASRSGK